MLHKKRPSPPPDRPPRRSRRRFRSPWLYVFALIGVGTVLFLLIKYLIIPFILVPLA